MKNPRRDKYGVCETGFYTVSNPGGVLGMDGGIRVLMENPVTPIT